MKASAPVKIAVLDDNPRICKTIQTYLRQIDCETELYTDPGECLERLKNNPVDIVITDVRMPDVDGIMMLKKIRKLNPSTDVIVISGHADKNVAIEALKFGAFDFFEKPVNSDELLATIKRTVRYREALRQREQFERQVSFLSEREAKRWGIESFVGRSRPISDVVREIRKIQESDNTSVLITGESGTGKELVARAIHFGGARSCRPFVPLNCSAVPENLAESTLFGHVKGAFTGATADRKGCFDLADGGTLFLDEIGDMPPVMQTKLLRVLEDGCVMPVGGATQHSVDVRIIAATNTDISSRLESGAFRSDLYHRLAVFMIELPPLRSRGKDIALLAGHFAGELASEMGIAEPSFSAEAMNVLEKHRFPGNVRELKNLIERALLESGGGEIKPRHLRLLRFSGRGPGGEPADTAGETVPEAESLPLNLQEAEKIVIEKALSSAGGNVSKAARLLGINRTKLYRKMSAMKSG